MHQRRHRWYGAVLGLIALLLATQIAFAQIGGYAMTWWTIDGGVGQSEGGSYTLRGSIGQPDAGRLGGGDYTLAGGFWNGDRSTTMRVYLSMVVR
jgi:hypothetical protein